MDPLNWYVVTAKLAQERGEGGRGKKKKKKGRKGQTTKHLNNAQFAGMDECAVAGIKYST